MRVERKCGHPEQGRCVSAQLRLRTRSRPEPDRYRKIRRRPRMRQEPRLSDRGLRPSHRARWCGVNPPGRAVSRSGPPRPSSPDSTHQGSRGGEDGFRRSSAQSTSSAHEARHEPDAFHVWTATFCFAGPPLHFSCESAVGRRIEHRLRQPVASINSIALGHDANATHEGPRTDWDAVTEAVRGQPESAVLHMIRAGGPARSATRAATRPRSSARDRSDRRNRPPCPVLPFPPARRRSPETRTLRRRANRALRGTADR